MRSSIKTFALVMRYTNYRDNDRMLTLFSGELGRLDAAAYGARRVKSPLLAASQPFTYGEYLFDERRGRITLRQCEIADSFFDLRTDMDKFATAGYIGQLCLEAVHPGEGNMPLFTLALKTLSVLCYGDVPAPLVRLAFSLNFMDILGFRPQLDRCVICRREVPEGQAMFSAEHGGIVCGRCECVGAADFPPRARTSARLLLDADMGDVGAIKLGTQACVELELIIKPFMEHRLERKFTSSDVISKLLGFTP